MPSSVESEILSRAQTLVADLTALIRESAFEAFSEALASQAMPGGRGRRATRAPAGRVSVRTSVSSGRAKGAKRDPAELEALTEKLAAFIKKTPAQRIEQIGKALATPTKDLALPVKKLIAAKRVSTKGHKRATTYFAK